MCHGQTSAGGVIVRHGDPLKDSRVKKFKRAERETGSALNETAITQPLHPPPGVGYQATGTIWQPCENLSRIL